MDPPSRSPALNPASTPFFPGAMRVNDEETISNGPLGAYRQSISRDQHYSTTSSISISPLDYHSVRSSPSPHLDDGDRQMDNGLQVPASGELSRRSPSLRQPDTDRGLPTFQHPARELNISPKTGINPDGDETPGPMSGPIPMNGQLAAPSMYGSLSMRSKERLVGTPPVIQESMSLRSSFVHQPFLSSSPASSLDSGSHFAPSLEFSTSFEQQLKSSPLINEVLERLANLEATNRDIQRNLGDVNRKVDILVERALNPTPGLGPGPSAMNAPVEFKDPFAPSSQSNQGFINHGLGGPRGSIANIAPNQNPPSDDIPSISSRLNTLTSSVAQLLALQTQQIQNSGMQNAQMMGGPLPPTDLPAGLPPMMNSAASLGHGMPGRPDVRQNPRLPNPPMRTWSAGTLDLPLRNESPAGSMGRQDSIFRDKRRSVTSGILRRDSVGVSI